MVSQEDGRSLYIFGGSDEGCNSGIGGQAKIREVDTDVYVIRQVIAEQQQQQQQQPQSRSGGGGGSREEVKSDCMVDGEDDNEDHHHEELVEEGEEEGMSAVVPPTRWTFTKPPMKILTFDHEAPVRVKPSHLRSDLQSLLEAPILPDINLKGGSESSGDTMMRKEEEQEEEDLPLFRAHKALLTLRCRHFQAMLTSGMKEANASVVTIQDIDSHLLKMILQYIYTVGRRRRRSGS